MINSYKSRVVFSDFWTLLEFKVDKENNRFYIVIGLATFQRPVMLARALDSLKNIRVPEDVVVRLVLVDNDALGSAKAVYEKYSEYLPFQSEYQIENKRGISNVRNTILSRALSLNAQYLAFFDDDERVCEDWLRALFSTIKSHDCHAVSGKVIYEFPNNTEQWIRNGNFFNNKNFVTGTVQDGAGSGNVIIDLGFVKQHDLIFNKVFNMSGGEDSHFFSSLIQQGGKIVWCQEAITYEEVPQSRLTESWVLGRACKVGYTTLLRHHLENNTLDTLFFGFKFILSQLGMFLFNMIPSIYNLIFNHKRSSWVSLQRKLYKIKGAYKFLISKNHVEYQNIHGD